MTQFFTASALTLKEDSQDAKVMHKVFAGSVLGDEAVISGSKLSEEAVSQNSEISSSKRKRHHEKILNSDRSHYHTEFDLYRKTKKFKKADSQRSLELKIKKRKTFY